MTPKEKAIEIFDKFYDYVPDHSTAVMSSNSSKQCALICVEEVANALPYNTIPKIIFWTEVKEEIEKL